MTYFIYNILRSGKSMRIAKCYKNYIEVESFVSTPGITEAWTLLTPHPLYFIDFPLCYLIRLETLVNLTY